MLNKIDIKYWTDFAYQVLYDKWMYNYYINREYTQCLPLQTLVY